MYVTDVTRYFCKVFDYISWSVSFYEMGLDIVSGQGGVEMRVSRRRTLHNDDEYSSLYFVQSHYNVLNDAKKRTMFHLMSAGGCFRKHGGNKEIYKLHAYSQSE